MVHVAMTLSLKSSFGNYLLGPSAAMNQSQPTVNSGPSREANARDDLIECLAFVAKHAGAPRSIAAIRAGLPRYAGAATPDMLIRAAQQIGFSALLIERKLKEIHPFMLPAVLLLDDGRACVLCRIAEDGNSCEVMVPDSDEELAWISSGDLAARYTGQCVFLRKKSGNDERAGVPAPKADQSWFWGTLWRFRRYYGETVVAAVLVNLLALAGTFFIMNVYDRVVPNQAYATLWVLGIGAVVAMVFEFAMRCLRAWFIDTAGKKADLILGSALFRQTMALRLEQRPASSGAFANLLREFETVRDFAASATLAALTDLPFVALFLFVIALVAGPLVCVPVAAVPLVAGAGLLVQWPLSRIMQENLRESSVKHGVLIEAVEGLGTLKANNAEGFMQKRWEDASAHGAQTATKSRFLSGLAMNYVVFTQQVATVVMVVWGVYLIHGGQLSMGALIAAVMLGGRALGPLGQVATLAVRYQSARAAFRALDALMRAPVERESHRAYLNRPRLSGALVCADLWFAYPGQQQAVVEGVSLRIEAGERVAVLGRVGSGKSTLLKVAAGLYRPLRGQVLLDGVDIQQIEPADVRRNLAYVEQEARLFYGTLRDNIMLASPRATDEELLSIARMTGLDRVAARHPLGFDMPVGERGEGLSGGQKQLVSLARCLLSSPAAMLFDEPTGAMDTATESMFIAGLRPLLAGRTMVVATHRRAMLSLVSRVIVVDGGRVVADGPRDRVLAALAASPMPVDGLQPARAGK